MVGGYRFTTKRLTPWAWRPRGVVSVARVRARRRTRRSLGLAFRVSAANSRWSGVGARKVARRSGMVGRKEAPGLGSNRVQSWLRPPWRPRRRDGLRMYRSWAPSSTWLSPRRCGARNAHSAGSTHTAWSFVLLQPTPTSGVWPTAAPRSRGPTPDDDRIPRSASALQTSGRPSSKNWASSTRRPREDRH